MYETYKNQAQIYLVYIKEAHPSDGGGKAFGRIKSVEQPTTYEERRKLAGEFVKDLKLDIPTLVDSIDNKTSTAYATGTERVYVIGQDGKVFYKTGRGALGCKVDDAEAALGKMFGKVAAAPAKNPQRLKLDKDSKTPAGSGADGQPDVQDRLKLDKDSKTPAGSGADGQPDVEDRLKLDKDSNATEGGEAYSFTFQYDNAQEPLKGILLKPAGKGPFPAVVINHGKGGSPQAFRRYGETFVQKGFVAIAPELTHAGQNAGDPQTFAASKENAERILAAVQVLESRDYVDAKKLCMYGHSMGAFATVGTCTQTDKFQAAAITAGGLRPRGNLDTEENVAKITTPFLILHGTDDKVVNVDMGKNFKAALDKHKKTSELKLFEGVGHQLPNERRDEVFPLVLAFFEKHLNN